MESLGEKLKSARENKDISLDQAGKDTRIAVRYLQALEQEDFSVFPGEAYVTGFIRNYSAYLDLNVNDLLSLYKNLQLQEQPIPEQLLKRPSSWPKIVLGIAIAVLVLGLTILAIALLATRPKVQNHVQAAPRSTVEYQMSGDIFERHFFIGDSILVADGSDLFKVEFFNLGETVIIQTLSGRISLDLGQEENIILNNSDSVLKIKALDYDKNKTDMGARLHFELIDASEGIPFFAIIDETVSADSPEAVSRPVSAVLFSSPNPYPFTLQAVFQGYCMFRWEVLMERDRRDRNERYFQRNDELNIQAQNGIRLWTSNAQAAKFQVIGGGRTVPFELGAAGEIVVAEVRWVRDDSRFRLIVTRLES